MTETQEILDTIGEALRRVLEVNSDLPDRLRALLETLDTYEQPTPR